MKLLDCAPFMSPGNNTTMKRSLLRSTSAWVAAVSLVNPALLVTTARADALSGIVAGGPATPPTTGPYGEPVLTAAGATASPGVATATDPARQGVLTVAQKVALLRQKVKYVFVLFQENRSFDAYFGTYPGVNGLFATYPGANASDPYAQPATVLASFASVIENTDGSFGTVQPFLLPRTIVNQAGATTQIWPEDTYSVDHSHGGYMNDFHADAATRRVAKNDGYALDQEGLHYATDASGAAAPIFSSAGVTPTAKPSLATKQKGEVAMSHIDCDTIPFLWQYADAFTLFDNFHQTATGPSTPNAIAMIAGQVGDTQWVEHGSVGYAADGQSPSLSVPNLTDNGPFAGSSSDTAVTKPPYGPDESTAPLTSGSNFGATSYPPNANLTFASLPLSFFGSQASSIAANDQAATVDLADVQQDLLKVAMSNKTVDWGWYQQGYGPEPFDGTAISENGGSYHWTAAPQHASYISHHNGPQYFGYVGDNPAVASHLHSLGDFYTAVSTSALSTKGGVYYVRGGYYNNDGMKPADPNATVQAATPGNDDHPNYSDAGISEALVADSINAIAASKYWKNSAIIVTYDETDGLYDHQPEQFRTFGPDHLPETGGPRIPAIVISPYAASHVVSHVYSEHSSVIQFINTLFNLVPLSDLPNEAAAREAGATNAAFNAPDGTAQKNLGPGDDPANQVGTAGMGNMLEAFDDYRLLGIVPTIPASVATVPAKYVHALPAYGRTVGGAAQYGCQFLHVTPTDYTNGYATGTEIDAPPQDFNPRPTQSPGSPYLNTNGTGAAGWDPQM